MNRVSMQSWRPKDGIERTEDNFVNNSQLDLLDCLTASIVSLQAPTTNHFGRFFSSFNETLLLITDD